MPAPRCLPVLALLLSSLPAVARADAMCGGPRRPPPAPPPSTSSSPFAKPPPQGALPASGDARVAQIDPTSPVELGMFGGMILLGGIAGLSSRRKGKGEP